MRVSRHDRGDLDFARTTTGRSSPAPTARMVACGGLITAVKSLMPCMPRLETALAPPSIPPASACARGRAQPIPSSREMTDKDFVSALRKQRCYQPILDCHRDADVGMPVLEHCRFSVHVALASGRAAARSKCFDDEIVDRELPERLAILSCGAALLISSRAAKETADVAIDREVEVRMVSWICVSRWR